MPLFKKLVLLCLLATGLQSCHRALQPQQVQYAGYAISANMSSDSALSRMLQPYRDSVTNSMSAVVGHAAATLEKKAPAGSLGNFMADAVLHMAKQKYNQPVHFALVNYGGIRQTQLAEGPVTRGKIFELMPFDNLLVLQQLNGTQVQQLLNFLAACGGWPVAGVTFNIRSGKATEIVIDGKPFDPQQTYTIANSDYVANGGDDAAFLRSIPQISTGYLIRDALFDYVAMLQQQNRKIEANNETRINDVQ